MQIEIIKTSKYKSMNHLIYVMYLLDIISESQMKETMLKIFSKDFNSRVNNGR